MKIIAVLFLFAIHCHAQSSDRIQRTWKGPDVSAIWGLLKEESPKPQGRSNPMRFTPAADSGVAKVLVDAFGSSAEQRASLLEAFTQIKQGYEAEVAKEGKSNNLAAAMTFFIAANVAAYHQSELPSDADTDRLFESMQQAMAQIPAFAAMSNAEKQQLHDWLVYMGGFSLANYTDAKQNRDAQGLATIKDFADFSMRIVLGVEGAKLSLAGSRLNVSAPPVSATPITIRSSVRGRSPPRRHMAE